MVKFISCSLNSACEVHPKPESPLRLKHSRKLIFCYVTYDGYQKDDNLTAA